MLPSAIFAFSCAALALAFPATLSPISLAIPIVHPRAITPSTSNSILPFTAQDIALSRSCMSTCMPLTLLNATCSPSFAAESCTLCSTGSMDSYVTCANCMVAEQASRAGMTGVVLRQLESICTMAGKPAAHSIELNVKAATTISSSSKEVRRDAILWLLGVGTVVGLVV